MRKLKFRHIALLSVIVLASSNLNAQCSITKDNSSAESLTLFTKTERIYRNEDLENGLKTVFVQSALFVSKADKNMIKFDFIVTHAKSGYQPELVPREITFSFKNGQTLSAKADEYDSPVYNGVKSDRCFFRLSLENMNRIKDNAVSTLTVTDTRTGRTIVTSPYPSMFQEQIQCLLNAR